MINLKGIVIRKEFFGGLAYIKSKNIILELNKQGYNILSLVQNGENIHRIKKITKLSLNEINIFLRTLSKYNKIN